MRMGSSRSSIRAGVQQPDALGNGELSPAASTVLAAVPSLETRLNPALEHSVKKKNQSVSHPTPNLKPCHRSSLALLKFSHFPHMPQWKGKGEANTISHIPAPRTAKKPVSPGSLCPLVAAGFTAICAFSVRCLALVHCQPPALSCPLGAPAGQGHGRGGGKG